MTPDLYTYALPAVQIVGALAISKRISYSAHPALIAYLASETLWQVLPFAGIPSAQVKVWAFPAQVAIRAAVVCEVATFARIRISPEVRARIVGLVLAGAAFASSAATGLEIAERAYLLRQWVMLALCLGAGSVVVLRFARPMIECARHRVYRIGAAAWLAVLAGAACFVPRGIGYALFPAMASRENWGVLSMWIYVALIVVIGWTAAKMYASVKPRKSEARAVEVAETRRIAA